MTSVVHAYKSTDDYLHYILTNDHVEGWWYVGQHVYTRAWHVCPTVLPWNWTGSSHHQTSWLDVLVNTGFSSGKIFAAIDRYTLIVAETGKADS